MNVKSGRVILRLQNVPSTNDRAKTLRENGENLIVVAERQSGGMGTKGRSFSSEKGGLYLSALTFYDRLPASEAFTLMAGAATAVCKTLEKFSLAPKIKWPNDVYVCDKKICGILIENAFSGGYVANSVVGIGLNVNNPLPSELASIATSMKEILRREIPLSEVEETLIKTLDEAFDMEEYRKRLGYLGLPATLLVGEEKLAAIPCGVTDRGELIATVDGEAHVFPSAEVSLRLGNVTKNGKKEYK